MSTSYNHQQIESQHNEKERPFARGDKDVFSLLMPPPNVTGSLHLGHALTYTLQDVLGRYHRMEGKNVLLQPGLDHAGIATQLVVEKKINSQGLDKQSIGRDAFVQKVWEWRHESGDTIIHQLKKMGVSANWSRLCFTLDPEINALVRHAFVSLHEKGLIYQDMRLVNWDPHLQTALSDLEIIHREEKGTMWTFSYPFCDDPNAHLPVATTRPETLFGDQALAVHPEDERYKKFVGRFVTVPLAGHAIPIVADTYCNPLKGTGVVKITPAHDFNDCDVAKRHSLPFINIFDKNACLNHQVPQVFRGLDRFEGRKQVVSTLSREGYLIQETPIVHQVPYAERSGTMIEPWMTQQWYLDAKTLAQPAIEAVEKEEIVFEPSHWKSTYFQWMNNIHPWCISRQLWWGHRIPAWYGPDGSVFVAIDETHAKKKAFEKYKKDVPLREDEDVLDTWFSSALWPLATLGWPHKSDFEILYPTSVLVTGFDIIFFWVARMIMLSWHFTQKVPFRKVYVHALMRDEKGQKMSKSKGNAIDPLALMETYGADALRFSLALLAAPGKDISFGVGHIQAARHFMIKLWNAHRFCLQFSCSLEGFSPQHLCVDINKWIVAKVGGLGQCVSQALQQHQFHSAASQLYHFIWGVFCDRYIECAKFYLHDPLSQEHLKAHNKEGSQNPIVKETQQTLLWVFQRLLLHLSPFAPFIARHLWEKTTNTPMESELWPRSLSSSLPSLENNIESLFSVIHAVRSLRSELSIPFAIPLEIRCKGETPDHQSFLKRHEIFFIKHLNLRCFHVVAEQKDDEKGFTQQRLQGLTLMIKIEGLVDWEKEKERLQKRINKTKETINKYNARLEDPSFQQKAPADILKKTKQEFLEEQKKQQTLQHTLQCLAHAFL